MKFVSESRQSLLLQLCLLLFISAGSGFGQSSIQTPNGCITVEEQYAEKPQADYYASVYRLTGTALRSALHNLIKGHTVVSYSSLYTYYASTDNKPSGKIWDMYSDVPNGTPAYEYTLGTKQCGNYAKEGDCYNREHQWCEAWYGTQSSLPIYSDLFNVYPTDGYVNNRRSNYTYGEVSTPTWTSTNGSKLGPNTFPGNTSVVFEPIDAYKGDFARSHFYISTRYYTEDAGWSSTPGTNLAEILPWYANMLYKWHMKDTVSTKEVNRNNAVYAIQHNRNPFIDHPEFVAEIWMTAMAPSVISAANQSTTTTVLSFSRYLDSAAAVNPANFTIDNGIGAPAQVIWGVNNNIAKLQLISAALVPGTVYSVQVKNQKSINAVAMNDTVIKFTAAAPTAVKDSRLTASTVILEQNYPNPFNPTTKITFSIHENTAVSLKIYDMMGREVTTLVNTKMNPGKYSVDWNAVQLSSGVYFSRLSTNNLTVTRKMLLMK